MTQLEDLMKLWPVLSFSMNAVGGVVLCLGVLKMQEIARKEVKAVTDPMNREIDAIDTRVALLDQRIGEVEDDITNLPTKEDIARVEGEVKGVSSQVGAAAEGIRRLEGYFLESGVRSRMSERA